MFRSLPANPNLEHLKKQAKDRLRELQAGRPDAQLADAQHELAREYGFASWPKLKAHVESVSANPFAGRWTANLAKSRRHPLHQFRSVTLEVVAVGATFTITDVVVDEHGREERHTNTIRADGLEHPSNVSGLFSVRTSSLGPRVLEAVGLQDGQIVGVSRYEVSPAGDTLTLSGRAGSETDYSQVVVFERA